MFERYTEPARRALFFARFEATRLAAGQIETDHLLLGLLNPGTHTLYDVCERAGLTLEKARVVLHRNTTAAVPLTVEIPFTVECRRALEHAADEADAASSGAITPAHLLVGVLRDDTSRASQLLQAHGISLAVARRAAQPQAGAET
jgi:ATP-dependent Clp protease ATP-binding subunit ClpC